MVPSDAGQSTAGMSTNNQFNPVPQLSADLNLPAKGVAAVVTLLGEGNTVPFIARYRKEATGGLDEVQIRAIEERRGYLREMHDRRGAIIKSIDEQGKLTPALRAKIDACTTKAELEDLYLPYKRKRRTRAMIARERGLEPLAQMIIDQPADKNPEAEARAFVDADKGVDDTKAALAGARDIVAELVAERADVRAMVRRAFAQQGVLECRRANAKSTERTKFEHYYEFSEPVKTIPSHRFLAIRRGEREKVLKAAITVDVDRLVDGIDRAMDRKRGAGFSEQLGEAIRDCYKRLLAPSVETDVRVELKLRSDGAAVDIFADNLRNLLLAAPFGPRSTIGIDPGLRTGCKCAAVDATGKYLDHITIYLAKNDTSAAHTQLTKFIVKHRPSAIAVGNGTGGRETESFVRKLLAESTTADKPFVVQVNEAGASVYSASDLAREEFPKLDLTIRGAISIARRLQDPLAELVKVEPKAIGVGQYQHDVHQPLLQRKLGHVVESCVNHVGVELNTASAPLLSYVAGIGPNVAKKIVGHREQQGAFRTRRELLKVSGLGPRAFEQCAGFLRIQQGKHPLDASAVHPERYKLVERIAKDLKVSVAKLVGNATLAGSIDHKRYVGDGVGEPTLRDIVDELKKPGRDPRSEFAPPKFRDDVNSLEDLTVGMKLEGVVTNVTAFGAFVDVGVHQDGLVHISQLADKFVKDPKDVVSVGDKINVRVLEVDTARRRIALSARSDAPASGPSNKKRPPSKGKSRNNSRPQGGGGRRDKPAARKQRSSQPKKQPAKFSNNPFAKLGKK